MAKLAVLSVHKFQVLFIQSRSYIYKWHNVGRTYYFKYKIKETKVPAIREKLSFRAKIVVTVRNGLKVIWLS
jgi:hypothetical protein